MNKNLSPYYSLNQNTILFLLCFILFNLSQNTFAQTYSPNPPFNNVHFKKVVIAESAVAAIGLIRLYYLWYKKFQIAGSIF
jgi:hypothetical protein